MRRRNPEEGLTPYRSLALIRGALALPGLPGKSRKFVMTKWPSADITRVLSFSPPPLPLLLPRMSCIRPLPSSARQPNPPAAPETRSSLAASCFHNVVHPPVVQHSGHEQTCLGLIVPTCLALPWFFVVVVARPDDLDDKQPLISAGGYLLGMDPFWTALSTRSWTTSDRGSLRPWTTLTWTASIDHGQPRP